MALDRLTQITSSGISSTSTITVSAIAGVLTATSATVGSVITMNSSGINAGVVTATNVNVGSAVTIHTGGFRVGSSDLHSTGVSLNNINASGVVTATSFVGNVTGNITGNISGNVTGNVNSTGVSTFATANITQSNPTNLNVSGVSTFAGITTVTGTTLFAKQLNVSGVVTATSFVGDGTNLTNTGSTLSAASGSQRVVLTGQTSGTMTASATDSALTFSQSTGTLSATKFSGDGSALTGIAATTNVRTNSLVVSGVTTLTTLQLSAVPGTNTNADLGVLFQTSTGVIDGGSSLTFNPAGDQLKVNGLSITSQQIYGNGAALTLTTQNGNGTSQIEITDTTLQFKTGATERARIDASGNLGIGTVTPSTSNGVVSRNVAIAGANNVNLAFQSSTVGYGGLLEFRRFGRTGDARYAQIGGNTDGSDHGYFNFFLARASSGVSELMRLNTVSVTDRSIQGVLGVNDTSPESSAVAARFTGGGDTALPVVSIQRTNNSGGGTGNVEIGLDVQINNTYNSGGEVFGVKSFARHNLGGQHYAGYFVAGGMPYSNGIGVYAETRHTDSNGPGLQPAIYAYGANTGGPVNGPGGCYAIHAITNNHVSNVVARFESQYSGSPTQTAIQFVRNNNTVGSITFTLSNTAYNTSSDYRLKENIVPLENAEERLRQIPVKRFSFIDDPDTIRDGFIAHEVSPFVPEAVTGVKDEMEERIVKDIEGKDTFDGDGNPILETVPKYQGIDQSKLVPLLTAALQEAFVKIDAMEERIAALENP